MSVVLGLPLMLEDRTGSITNTTFRDICAQRLALTVSSKSIADRTLITVSGAENIQLEFMRAGLGKMRIVSDGRAWVGDVDSWMRGSLLGSPLIRCFSADGEEYSWKLVDEMWVCTSVHSGYVVAEYENVDPLRENTRCSGWLLTIQEAFGHIASEIVASLLVMRHITNIKTA